MEAIQQFFCQPQYPPHRQYEAMRAYFIEGLSAHTVAKQFDYTENSIYSLASDFKKLIENGEIEKRFFAPLAVGRKPKDTTGKLDKLILELRKKYLSVSDIKTIIDTQDSSVSETYIFNLLKREGFARLPRRSKQTKAETLSTAKIRAPEATILTMEPEAFNTTNIGLLCFLPLIKLFGLDEVIINSIYPETKALPRLNSILCFLALKLSNIRRYTVDDLWCMDRGLGLFAGCNVLPKAAWFSSYSHRITREMNIEFLKSLRRLWSKQGLLSDTANLDFVTIPYWGDDSHLENNWSGTRRQALSSILAVIAHHPDTGMITYGDTTVRHDHESEVIVEFLDFHKQSGDELNYLVFDSKFTTYQNLSKLDDNEVKFVTIRRRGKNIVDKLNSLPNAEWKKVRVPSSTGKKRQVKVNDQCLFLKGYGKEIRQIAITGHGKIKPALIITNDFSISCEEVIRKYARRWLVEKTISEQTHFFHLNRVSSSMVIKVDFDLVMTILAHNLYRLLANELPGYTHNTASSLYEKFIYNSGTVSIKHDLLSISMKKKRNLPALLSAMNQF